MAKIAGPSAGEAADPSRLPASRLPLPRQARASAGKKGGGGRVRMWRGAPEPAGRREGGGGGGAVPRRRPGGRAKAGFAPRGPAAGGPGAQGACERLTRAGDRGAHPCSDGLGSGFLGSRPACRQGRAGVASSRPPRLSC